MLKRRCALLLALLLLSAALAAPAGAAEVVQGSADRYIYDNAGILTAEERDALESAAASLSARYGCGIYAIILEDFTFFGFRYVEDAAESFYHTFALGLGGESSGILLMLSMEGRDYDLCAYGYGNTAFTDYGKQVLAEQFLDNFRRDDWYGGISDYVAYSGELLSMAAEGNPLDSYYASFEPQSLREAIGVPAILVIAAAAGCLVALAACSVMKAGMRSVRKASGANRYAVPRSFDVYESADVFSHFTETRTRVESDSERDGGGGGGGGGGTSVNSGGFSHSSGKY